jgi:hypothetical protein
VFVRYPPGKIRYDGDLKLLRVAIAQGLQGKCGWAAASHLCTLLDDYREATQPVRGC